jgi:hypothetical protein
MRMSIGNCIVAPTPTAGPFTAAITGFFDSKIRSVSRPPPSRCSSMDSARVAEVERAAASREVRACAECAACAGDDDGAHVVVGVGARERIEQLVLHAPGVGVSACRDGAASA